MPRCEGCTEPGSFITGVADDDDPEATGDDKDALCGAVEEDADTDADAEVVAFISLRSVLFPKALRESRRACEYLDNAMDSSSLVSINVTRVCSSGAGLFDSIYPCIVREAARHRSENSLISSFPCISSSGVDCIS